MLISVVKFLLGQLLDFYTMQMGYDNDHIPLHLDLGPS
jgi:hypothetical protein